MTEQQSITLLSNEIQYQTVIEGIYRNEDKRQNAINVYGTLTVAIVTAASSTSLDMWIAAVMVGTIQFILLAKIKYHRALASIKFSILDKIEHQMNCCLFKTEWDEFKRRKMIELTQIECYLPILIMIICTICTLIDFVRWFNADSIDTCHNFLTVLTALKP